MGGFLSIPILALAAILQSTVAPQVQILGGRPDLVLLLVVAWSVNVRLDEGVTWAFVGGIIQDLLSAAPTGTSALGMVLLVFAVGGLNRQVYRIGFLLLSALVIGGTLLKEFVRIAVLLAVGYQFNLLEISYVIVPTLAYNLLFIWPVYWFVRRVQRRLGEDGGRSA